MALLQEAREGRRGENSGETGRWQGVPGVRPNREKGGLSRSTGTVKRSARSIGFRAIAFRQGYFASLALHIPIRYKKVGHYES